MDRSNEFYSEESTNVDYSLKDCTRIDYPIIPDGQASANAVRRKDWGTQYFYYHPSING